MNLLHTLGLMTRAEHEAAAEANERQADRIRSLEGDVRRMTIGRDAWRSAAKHWEAKFKRAATDLAAMDVTEWSSHIGDPPDGDSPLLCVYDAGIGYAYDRLAEWLGVDDYELGDGSEEYATDVGRTGANVLVAAGFVNEDGDLLTREDMAELKADAEAMRKKRDADRKRMAGKRGKST